MELWGAQTVKKISWKKTMRLNLQLILKIK